MATRRKWIFYNIAGCVGISAKLFVQNGVGTYIYSGTAVIRNGNERWDIFISTYILMFCACFFVQQIQNDF